MGITDAKEEKRMMKAVYPRRVPYRSRLLSCLVCAACMVTVFAASPIREISDTGVIIRYRVPSAMRYDSLQTRWSESRAFLAHTDSLTFTSITIKNVLLPDTCASIDEFLTARTRIDSASRVSYTTNRITVPRKFRRGDESVFREDVSTDNSLVPLYRRELFIRNGRTLYTITLRVADKDLLTCREFRRFLKSLSIRFPSRQNRLKAGVP